MNLLKFWKQGSGQQLRPINLKEKSPNLKNNHIFLTACNKSKNERYKNFLRRIFNHLAVFLILIYRVIFSSWMGGCCRYIPSCSEYALQSFKSYPFFKAAFLSFNRILRCFPYGGLGYDPLPQKTKEVIASEPR